MARSMWLSIIVLAAVTSESRAPIFLTIVDPVDDSALVGAVSGQKPVKEFAAEIEAFEKTLLANDEEKIEKLLGKPVPKPENGYAMPIAQQRHFIISGLLLREDKSHTDYYPIGDFAGIEISYGASGTSRQFAVLYFKVDNHFPRLQKVEDDKTEEPKKKPAVIRTHRIDEEHWDQLKEGMNLENITKIFSVPAGDYAPGTDYLTRSWGWKRGSNGPVSKTLEWRSEKGRVVVDFDENGNFVTSEFYHPGRDPVTNVAERLKWDRHKFAKVKKYIEAGHPFFFPTSEPFPAGTWILIIVFFAWLPFSIVMMRKTGKIRWLVLILGLLLLLMGITVAISEFQLGYSYRQSEHIFEMRPFWYNTYWKRLVTTAIEALLISTGMLIVGALMVEAFKKPKKEREGCQLE